MCLILGMGFGSRLAIGHNMVARGMVCGSAHLHEAKVATAKIQNPYTLQASTKYS